MAPSWILRIMWSTEELAYDSGDPSLSRGSEQRSSDRSGGASMTSIVAVSTRSVIPKQMTEWELGLRDIASRAAGQSDPLRYCWFQTVAGDLTQFHLVLEHRSFDEAARDQDIYGAVRRAYGELEGSALLDRLRGCFQTAVTVVIHSRDDLLDLAHGPIWTAPFAELHRYTVRPGRQRAFEEWARHLVEAWSKRHDGRVGIYQPVYGAPDEYWLVRGLAGMQDLDRSGSPSRVLVADFGGEAAERLEEQRREAVSGAEVELIRRRPELSRTSREEGVR